VWLCASAVTSTSRNECAQPNSSISLWCFINGTFTHVLLSQAATPGANKLTVMKLSDLHRIPRAQREEDDGDEEAGIDLENADSDDDEECDEVNEH